MLKGKTALVTGSTSGIGLGVARIFAENGANIVLNGFGDADEIETIRTELEKTSGAKAVYNGADMTRPEEIRAMCEEAISTFGAVDILVNNAGISRSDLAVNISEEDYDAVLDTNLKGPFILAQEVGRRMIERGEGGSIINISSMLAYRSYRGLATYAMSKAGMVAMTRSLALEWAKYNINVNTICPGYIETEMNKDYFHSEKGKAVVAGFPGQALGKLDDLNGTLLLLASGASAFMTGSTIELDGGQPL